ncbi:MAG: formate/nitrite transporter family protein [Chloroflexota bacterium]
MAYSAPSEVAEATVATVEKKAALSIPTMLVLGIAAGAFVAFGGEASTMATQDITVFGLSKYLASVIFGTALMMVIIAGGELFTGNSLLIIGVLQRRFSVGRMLRNWSWVYCANLIGSLLVVALVAGAGLYKVNNGVFAAATVKAAYGKLSLTFMEALARGILCNWLVTLAVWMAYAAKDIAGKVLAIFFPISAFVISGFEHSIANMYYIPAGIVAKAHPAVAALTHLTADQLASLNVTSFLVRNLLPVTIGNIIGGALFVGTLYWFAYLRKASPAHAANRQSTVVEVKHGATVVDD